MTRRPASGCPPGSGDSRAAAVLDARSALGARGSGPARPAGGPAGSLRDHLLAVFHRLHRYYGPLRWWPAETPFEVIVGAVLTQNTSWGNVEKAIANLKAAGLLEPAPLRKLSVDELVEQIRPSGTYRVKARRLRALLAWLGEDPQARLAGDLEMTRRELLRVPGIGPETADAILLYAAGRPTFVVDAYTRRVLQRLELHPEERSYEGYRRLFMEHLPEDPALYNEYHAQLVQLGKDHCRATPKCQGCPLREVCAIGRGRST
ncbi:MAG: endonuclease III domain-containing protein [Chloroflexi bacterium]|nr:endonuclease III domain-containing protein [Chloroflexota bacterium]